MELARMDSFEITTLAPSAPTPARVERVSIAELTLDPELQPRCRLDQEVVAQYALLMLSQGKDNQPYPGGDHTKDLFPPVTV
jgi:hypothetical protein